MNLSNSKIIFFATTGVLGGIFTEIFGEWTSDITTLVIFMAIDYILGLIVAGIYKRSDKSKNGALSSKAAFLGLGKKVAIMLMVLVANRLDILMSTNFVKSGTVIAFCCSELISIAENLGAIDVPLPKVIRKAIDILKNKEEDDDDDDRNDSD